MKKILLLAGIGILAYTYKDKIFPSKTTAPETGGTVPALDGLFAKYNNQIVVDSKGYWVLLKGGKMYTPLNYQSVEKFAKDNPTAPEPREVSEDIWEYFLNIDPSYSGGSF